MTVMQRALFIDGHVHLYQKYNISEAIRYGFMNMRSAVNSFVKSEGIDNIAYIWLLTERSDCNFFDHISRNASKMQSDGLRFTPLDDQKSIIASGISGKDLYLLTGRQIVTKERLEILTYASSLNIEDGKRSIDDVIDNIIDSNGIAVLNWAPGKWFFSRGKIIRRVLDKYQSRHVFVGDTLLRNVLWPTPRLMRLAKKRGFRITAGSDPFPFEGEEQYIGSYGFMVTGEFDEKKPADSVLSLLRSRDTKLTLFGKRNNVVDFIRRQYKIMTVNR